MKDVLKSPLDFPWSYEGFLKKATEVGHPTSFCKLVPQNIQDAIGFHASRSLAEVSKHRLINWCKHWLRRAKELDVLEKQDALQRNPATSKKRLRLTREMLDSSGYEDISVLDMLEAGITFWLAKLKLAVFFSRFTNHVSQPLSSYKKTRTSAISW